MSSIGETLRQARHDRKVSLEDAARATKIKLNLLEHLEADEFGALAGPMYTKGFLKLYAEYLGLDSNAIVSAYLKDQGGLQRQGLRLETAAALRAQRPGELQLPIEGVVRVVAVVTLAALVGWGGLHWLRRRPTPDTPATPAAFPVADQEAYYQSKTKATPAMLDLPAQ